MNGQGKIVGLAALEYLVEPNKISRLLSNFLFLCKIPFPLRSTQLISMRCKFQTQGETFNLFASNIFLPAGYKNIKLGIYNFGTKQPWHNLY